MNSAFADVFVPYTSDLRLIHGEVVRQVLGVDKPAPTNAKCESGVLGHPPATPLNPQLTPLQNDPQQHWRGGVGNLRSEFRPRNPLHLRRAHFAVRFGGVNASGTRF
jgi:hypothetical protein